MPGTTTRQNVQSRPAGGEVQVKSALLALAVDSGLSKCQWRPWTLHCLAGCESDNLGALAAFAGGCVALLLSRLPSRPTQRRNRRLPRNRQPVLRQRHV